MLKKITLKNFMSHKHSVLELSKGLNVLTGSNNSGKSAVISALQLLADLPSKEGDYMVRHGTNETEVAVQTDAGDELIWQRTGSTISLIINGERFVRLQNDREHYLDKLQKLLKLPKVSGSESKECFDIHFGTQKDPIFLINEPPSRAAVFFASSTDAGRLVEVREKYKALIKSKKAEQQKIKSELELRNTIISKLAFLDEIKDQVQWIRETHQQLPQQEKAYNQGLAFLQQIRFSQNIYQRYLTQFQTLKFVESPPKIQDTSPLAELLTAIMHESKRVKIGVERAEAFSRLAKAPDFLPAEELGKDLLALKQAFKNASLLKRTDATLSSLEKQPKMGDDHSLNAVLKSIKSMRTNIYQCGEILSELKHLQLVPEVVDFKPLHQHLNDSSAYFNKLSWICAQLNEYDKLSKVPLFEDHQKLKIDLLSLQKSMRVCALKQKAASALVELKQPPSIPSLSGFETIFDQLLSAKKNHQIYSQQSKCMTLLQEPPRIEAVNDLKMSIKDHIVLRDTFQRNLKEMQDAEIALKAYVDMHPACPLCGSNFNDAQVEMCHA